MIDIVIPNIEDGNLCIHVDFYNRRVQNVQRRNSFFFSFRLYFYGGDNIEKILRLNVYIKTFIQEDAHCRSIFFVTKMDFVEIKLIVNIIGQSFQFEKCFRWLE